MLRDDHDIYLEVLLPLPLENPVFGYLASEEAQRGNLCVVPFGSGSGNNLTGLILSVSKDIPNRDNRRIRYKRIYRILPLPPIPEAAITMWLWTAEYTMCSPGEVLRAALPPDVDTYTGDALYRKVWTINPLLFSDEKYFDEVLSLLEKKKTAVAFLSRLLDTQPSPLPKADSLTSLSALTGLSKYTVDVLRDNGVVVDRLEDEDGVGLQETPHTVFDIKDDKLIKSYDWGDKAILLSYQPSSRVEERVPVELLQYLLSRDGGQHLLLFPTLDVLKQIEPLLKDTFGSRLFPYYHSVGGNKIKERSVLAASSGRSGLFYGLRAAVWLPFKGLRTVVITDEEERAYRQFEPAPRFTAAYVAMMLAKVYGAKTLLTSARPSVETAFRTFVEGRYALRDSTAVDSSSLSRLTLIDMEQSFQRGEVNARMLSSNLIQEITPFLDDGGRVLLLYQRQGYARYISCQDCHEVIKCPVCETVMRYYGGESRNLVCPACGHIEILPSSCPKCGQKRLAPIGTGVERLIRAVRQYFLSSDVYSVDGDLTNEDLRPGVNFFTGYDPSITLLQQADLIGVIQWDLMELSPDFRAIERSYRFISKVMSESREGTPVVVQFFRPYGVGLKAFLASNYKILMDYELESRFAVGFSPFSRQIDVIAQSGDKTVAFSAASSLVPRLSSLQSIRILGPSPLSPSRQEVEIGYRMTLLVPLSQKISIIRHHLRDWRKEVLDSHRGVPLYIYFDVDPQ